MLICPCSGTSDAQVRAAVRAGASNRREVARACRAAGQGCGSCRRAIDALIVEETSAPPASGEAVYGGLPA